LYNCCAAVIGFVFVVLEMLDHKKKMCTFLLAPPLRNFSIYGFIRNERSEKEEEEARGV
jgi:hypothetical protein